MAGYAFVRGVCKQILPLTGFNAAISSTSNGYFSGQSRTWVTLQTQASQYPYDGQGYNHGQSSYTVPTSGIYLMAASIGCVSVYKLYLGCRAKFFCDAVLCFAGPQSKRKKSLPSVIVLLLLSSARTALTMPATAVHHTVCASMSTTTTIWTMV